MHYICEIVMMPSLDIPSAVEDILKPFNENDSTEDNDHDRWWDWYEIGGRWSGRKFEHGIDKARLEEFQAWMTEEKITVSSVQAGKQTLSPVEQREKVDAKWREMFPDSGSDKCLLFDHAPRNIRSDVGKLVDCMDLKCARVIFAAPSYEPTYSKRVGPQKAEFMLCDAIWNGCNHMPVA